MVLIVIRLEFFLGFRIHREIFIFVKSAFNNKNPAENFNMDLNSICKEIYTFVCRATCGAESPVAYVIVKVGPEFSFKDSDLIQVFDKMKWNSPISSADLVIEHDSGLQKIFKVAEIQGFIDDDGHEKIYKVE